jgi:hypothetical protein
MRPSRRTVAPTHRRLGAQALSILLASFVPCMICGIGDRGELMEVEA